MTFEHWQQALERRYEKILLRCYRWSIPGKVRRMRKKDKIEVLFILTELGPWKTEPLYLAMLAHSRFNPTLGLAKSTEDTSFLKELEEYCIKKNYDYKKITEWDFGKPDIIFYQKPYDGVYPYALIYRNHLNALFCYAAYGIHALKQRWSTNQPLHRYAWQLYYENELTARSGRSLMGNNGRNIVVTGIPLMDTLMLPKEQFSDPWKPQERAKKRIIFAPHHTIGDMHMSGIGFSTFLDNAEYMLELVRKYKDTVQWAFKPHPLLKSKLEEIWGKEKTEAYYSQWEQMDNTQLATGEYLGLFKHSDAMIHDCSSFTVEYLYTGNPVLYLVRDEHHADSLNDFAKAAFDLHYHAFSQIQIDFFIQDTVLHELDSKRQGRKSFYIEYLCPPLGKSACENICEAILGLS